MRWILTQIFTYGCLVFALGLLWPLSTQIIEAAGWQPPFDVSAFWAGLIIALGLGIPAQIRGRWV